MTKIKIIAIVIIMIIFISIPMNSAKALDGGCTPGYGYELKNEDGTPLTYKSGVKITAIKEADPKNVVVIGQDPKGEGVSIQVTITSLTGKLEFDALKQEPYCDGPYATYGPDKNKTVCSSISRPDAWYYASTRYVCVHHNSSLYPPQDPAYRLVKSVRIWLEPSEKTAEWLNGGSTTSDGRFGLHYIYPEQWMVGMFGGGGEVSTQGTYTGMSGDYYLGWLSQMQRFNFLAGTGATYNEFLSNILLQVPNPIPDPNPDQNKKITSVLGLYGSFSPNPGSNMNTPDLGSIGIKCSDMSSNAHKLYQYETILLSCPFSDYYLNKDVNPPNAASVPTETITMDHIPLDVPGLWYIGVAVQVAPAQFYYVDPNDSADDTPVKEHPSWVGTGPDNSFWFGPTSQDTNYDMMTDPNDSFNSFIILTSPCNYQEVQGCWDESK